MDNVLDKKLNQSYQAGFTTNVESETLPPGLNEDTVRKISKIKNEPEWLLNFRLKAYNRWKVLKKPDWANLQIEPIDYQSISYYSAPKKGPASYDEVDPEIKKDFERFETVLFSCGGSSFNDFENYIERGKFFKSIVKNIKGGQN